MNLLRLIFDDDYRERMNYAAFMRADRRKRDKARARGNDTDARYHQFRAEVTRAHRLVKCTATR